MQQVSPSTLPSSRVVSIETHLESVAVGDIEIFTILTHDHPGMRPGDLIFVDRSPIDAADEKTRLLVEYNGRFILRQKRSVQAIMARAGLRVVGREPRETIRYIGRLIGWMHAKLTLLIVVERIWP